MRAVSLAAIAVAASMLAASAAAAPLRYEVVTVDGLPAREDTPGAERMPDMLPDGVVATGAGTIRAAWLIGPTRRYAHAVLGDDIEASGLAVRTANGEVVSVTLPPDAVFEDRIPRLVDLDGDGRDEVLVVKSTRSAGAALALYGVVDGRLVEVAASAPIGRAFRWLNPVGAGDFDGDGRVETAHVETPHIGGSLVLSRLMRGRLVEVAREAGFSNHRMGSPVLGLSMVLDADGDGVPDLLVPDDTRTSLRVVTFAGGVFRELARVDLGAELSAPLGRVKLRDGRDAVALGLSDGRIRGLLFER